MTDTQIVTITETATFTLTPELLRQIGVGAGDQIEIVLNDRAWVTALLFLEMNGVVLTVPEAKGEELCLGIADSRISRAEAEQYFAQWITSLA